jgi:hypothetical protein
MKSVQDPNQMSSTIEHDRYGRPKTITEGRKQGAAVMCMTAMTIGSVR